ncbi:3-hydroxybutyrate dehydrogenase [Hyphobacterium sp.]|jgi:3-hydroxybutyrate dehydrogenase|uniref:3-hydroxybutyrate dehydrogenase n=1 Tax=Hyphobacterium sp. TaxID=2004662 RepID=UPI003BA854EC
MTAQTANLQGQVAVVTGSTSGIGAALAEGLAAAGAHVVLNGLGDKNQIEALRSGMAKRHGIEVRYHPANMMKADETTDLVDFAVREFGRIDILVNNAGIQHVAKIEDFPPEKWDAIIAVNLTSAFHTIRAAVPYMRANQYGRIVNISSAHGLVASPYKSAYVSAKHGVMGLTKTVALEVAEAGITVNAICPGYVRTPLVDGQIADTAKARGICEEAVVRDVMLKAQPTKKFVEYDQLVGLLVYLVSDAGASCNGAAFQVDGGWTAQ